ncbi:kinase-like domain-containing protein [Dipodascopsis uninucleata]
MTSTLAPPRPRLAARGRKRSPNWAEFYRNGYPTDVIVIDDDTPPPQLPPLSSSGALNSAGHQQITESSSSLSASRSFDGSGGSVSSVSSMIVTGCNAAATPTSVNDHLRTSNEGAHFQSLSHMVNGAQTQQLLPSFLQQQQQLQQHLGGVDLLSSSPFTPTIFDALDGANNSLLDGHQYPPITVADLVSTPGISHPGVEISKKRKLECTATKRPAVKAKDVRVLTVSDPYFNKNNPKVDDDDGHYIIIPDSELTTRYKITKLLGQGTFGKVVAAYDRHKRTHCAIKIIRAIQKYRDASKIELRVLETLSMHDKNNTNKCIHLRDCFDYRNHICIVTDLLSISVFDFLKSNDFSPFPASHIQKFAKQLLTSVAFLHDLNLIHTDLKPENILLVDNSFKEFPYTKRNNMNRRKVLNDTTIHLIDFGSATFQDEYHSSVVSTRHYRAPEIILGLGWSFPCDMWSIGCILVEFLTGEALFQTHDNLEHLAMMEAVVGQPLDRSITKSLGRQAQKYFLKNGKLDYPNSQTTKTSRKYVRAVKPLDQIIGYEDSFHREFLNLLKRIFVYEPSERITAREALEHPWFQQIYIDEGSDSK